MSRKKKKKKRRKVTRSAGNKLRSRRRSSDIQASRSFPSMKRGDLTSSGSITEASGGVSEDFPDRLPGVLPEKPKLSVCMIVRDEERMLPRCLKSVQDVADELIVVDTGSKDNTISIAKDFGAKVFHFEWCDDFAAARNESIKHATGDWILQLDADEELLADSIACLKDRMLRPMILYYVIRCDNGSRCHVPRFEWVGRLFRRHSKLRYHRPYMEGVDRSVDNLMLAEPRWQKQYEPSIVIRHYGNEPSIMPKKHERGLRIMKSYIRQNPNDGYILTRLGSVCSNLGRYDEAEAYLNKALKISGDRPVANFTLGWTLQMQGKIERAIRCYKKVIATDPNFAEVYLNLGTIYVQKGMIDNAISELKRALAINPDLALGHNMLGVAYSNKGMLDEAITEYERAVAINPDLAGTHSNLALAYYLKQEYELAIQHCDKAVELGFEVHPRLLQGLRYVLPGRSSLSLPRSTNSIDSWDNTPQIVVPILGMHGSGTSMLTRMLFNMGVELGEPLQPPSFDNPRGFSENHIFQAINVRLLESAGCNRDGFDTDRTLKKTCQDLKRTIPKSAVEATLQYTKNAFQNTHWGWRDPRTVITWPFWERCLKQLGYTDIRPIILLRHPDSCLQSLKRHGDLSRLALPRGSTLEDHIATLWKTYYELIDSYLSTEVLVLLQEDLISIETAAREMERCAEYLGLKSIGIGPALATIDVNLVSHKKQDLAGISNREVENIYKTFLHRSKAQCQAFSQQTRRPSLGFPEVGMISGHFCIYIVSPDNYVHSHAFDEHALSLHHAFRDLGYIVPIVRYPWEISGTPIVFGAHLLPRIHGINLSPNSILYNLEQIHEGSPYVKTEYIDLLRRHQVWDYSRQNIHALKNHGVRNTKLCRVGYVVELSHIPQLSEDEQDIDILFYGLLNARRTAILNQFKEKSLRVGVFYGVYGNRRDRLIARAKITINIHFYESQVMEIIRLSFLMANKKFVVSERGNDQDMERLFKGGMVFADYHSLLEKCLAYFDNPSERSHIAARGYEIFSRQKQTDFLKEALG